jgi:hypothetical protein
VESSGVCVPSASVSCGAGTELIDGACLPSEATTQCGPGTGLVDGVCLPQSNLACGEGTERSGDVCVAVAGLRCGQGTSRVGDECVAPPDVVCGEGTELEDGTCVPAAFLCPEDQAWVGGDCVGVGARCGDGTIQRAEECVPVDPLEGIAGEEPAENNDPMAGGAAGVLSVPEPGEATYVRGVFGAADWDEDGVGDPDFDAFVIEARAGDRIELEVTAVGAPDAAFEVTGPGDYLRRAYPVAERNARRTLLLPYDGAYLVRFGTAANFSGVAPAQGADDFTWFAVVARAPAPEVSTFDEPSFVHDVQAKLAGEARVDLAPQTPVRLTTSGADAAQPVLLVWRDDAWEEVEAPAGRVFFVPEGGLRFVADQRITGMGRAVVVRADPGGAGLGAVDTGDRTLEGDALALGEGPAWSWELASGTVLRLDGPVGVEMTLTQASTGRVVRANERIELAVWEDDGFTLVLRGVDGAVAVRLRTWEVTSIGSLGAGDGLVRVRTPELASPAVLYTTVLPTQQGLATLGIRPAVGLDVNLSVFLDDLIASPEVTERALVAAPNGPGGYEVVSDVIAGGGRLLVRLEAASGAGRPTLEARLEPVVVEVEPNDDIGEALPLGPLGDDVLLTGAFEGEEPVTDDFYRFELGGPARITLRSSPTGLGPALGVTLAVYATDNPVEPLASASGSPMAPFSQLEATLLAGSYAARVRAHDDEGGRYVVRLAVLREFACLPDSEVCLDGDLALCGPGGEGFTSIECAADLDCVELDGLPTCGGAQEVEPNDLLSRAQGLPTLRPGRTGVRASLETGTDVDFYAVTLPEGGVLDLGTLPAGGDVATDLSVYTLQGELLAHDAGSGPDGHAFVGRLALAAGEYAVAVRSLQGAGDYRLFFSLRSLVCPLGDRRCDGNALEGCDGLAFSVVETCELGCVPGDPAACRQPPPPREVEPNDEPGLAFVAPELPLTVQGRIDPGDDVDWYRLHTDAQGVLLLGTADADTGDTVNTRVFLCSEQEVGDACAWLGPRTARNDDGDGRGGYSFLEQLVEAGDWWLAVESFGPDTGDYLVTLELGPLPGEPNDSWRSAGALGPEAPREFAIDVPGDADWYALDLTQAADIRLETRPIGQLGREVDTRIYVCGQLDPDACTYQDEGSHLAANDDGAGLGRYSRVDVQFASEGRYFVVVEAFGEQVGDYALVVTDVFEPNDGAGATAPIDVPSVSHGVLDGNEDWYETLVVFVGETHTFTTGPWGGRGAVDTRLRLVRLSDPETTVIENDDAEGLGVFSRLRYTFEAPGEYAIIVSGPDDQTRGGYILEAEAEF